MRLSETKFRFTWGPTLLFPEPVRPMTLQDDTTEHHTIETKEEIEHTQ
jgi:hypothetical protein